MTTAIKTQSAAKNFQGIIYPNNAVKPQIIEGFTPKQRADFQNGISIQDYAREKGIKI